MRRSVHQLLYLVLGCCSLSDPPFRSVAESGFPNILEAFVQQLERRQRCSSRWLNGCRLFHAQIGDRLLQLKVTFGTTPEESALASAGAVNPMLS